MAQAPYFSHRMRTSYSVTEAMTRNDLSFAKIKLLDHCRYLR
jgi:hypothetical protein